MAPPVKQRGWWRDYFYDHPEHKNRETNSAAYMSGKLIVWCKKCFDQCVSAELAADNLRVTSGIIPVARSPETITASPSFLLAWIENPEWLAFIEEWGVLSRLWGKGLEGTIQFDGWTGVNDVHIEAYELSANCEVQPMRVFDVSLQQKVAKVIRQVETEWMVIVIAVCSDAASKASKACRLLSHQQLAAPEAYQWPDIVVPDCYAHQINLIVGDYFKIEVAMYTHTAERATLVIAWLRSKSLLLALIHETHASTTGITLTVLHAVLTRWTAHYLAYSHLFELHFTIQTIVERDFRLPDTQKVIVIGDKKAKEKALTMIDIIQDPSFWLHLKQYHLQPLAITANISQSAHCWLDTILLIFGLLYHTYSMFWKPEDQPARNTILMSIEKLWIRFHKLDAPGDLLKEVYEYLDEMGSYKGLGNLLESIRHQAESEVRYYLIN
ncbi:hypothetical protein NEOLEDRAFT_1157439 [Neolentinus lepideus HHB14362 ss-1]|uniref:DUF659 domain-containing protein n=1 Tax=Neolentinus lepideus HHB14362 ss-1 TaxID=1314782 RepID=A0A165QWG6_9AGAM|nr:hypothetical protein NEOLEDRAFT_1157439 [Neolentinus lepideus HHB14362 ss-1]